MEADCSVKNETKLSGYEGKQNISQLDIISKTAAIFRSPKDDGLPDPYREAFVTKDVSCGVIPTLSFKMIHEKELFSALSKPDDYCGLVITSARTVDAIKGCFRINKCENSILKSWFEKPNFAVYESTAKYAEETFKAKFMGSKSIDLMNLSDQIERAWKPNIPEKAYLYPCSIFKNDLFLQRMENKGFKMEGLSCYETVPNLKMKEEWDKYLQDNTGLPEYLLFFSPTCVRFSMEQLHLQSYDKNFKVISMGPSTAEELKRYGFDPIFVPAAPTITLFNESLNLYLSTQTT